MSSYFCLIKLSARFITDVFGGNRFFFFLSKIGFCNTSTVTGQQHKEIIINRYEHYLYFEKKSLKKLTFFFRLTFEKWIRFFRGFFFHLIPQQRLLIMMTRIQFQYRETITTKLTKSQNIPTARDTHMIVIFNSIFYISVKIQENETSLETLI